MGELGQGKNDFLYFTIQKMDELIAEWYSDVTQFNIRIGDRIYVILSNTIYVYMNDYVIIISKYIDSSKFHRYTKLRNYEVDPEEINSHLNFLKLHIYDSQMSVITSNRHECVWEILDKK